MSWLVGVVPDRVASLLRRQNAAYQDDNLIVHWKQNGNFFTAFFVKLIEGRSYVL